MALKDVPEDALDTAIRLGGLTAGMELLLPENATSADRREAMTRVVQLAKAAGLQVVADRPRPAAVAVAPLSPINPAHDPHGVQRAQRDAALLQMSGRR